MGELIAWRASIGLPPVRGATIDAALRMVAATGQGARVRFPPAAPLTDAAGMVAQNPLHAHATTALSNPLRYAEARRRSSARRASSGSGAELEDPLEGPAGRVITPEVYACAAHILYPDPETHVRAVLATQGFTSRLFYAQATLRARGPLAVKQALARDPARVLCGPVVAALDAHLEKSQGGARVVPRKGALASSAHTQAIFLPQVREKGRPALGLQIKASWRGLLCTPHPRPCCALRSACSPPWA